jgi:threonyl-tRNA synthetase
MAQAVQANFPGTKIATGPYTEDGFYYDFDFGEAEFSDKDFKKIEKSMKKIVSQNQDFQMFEVSYDQAREIIKLMWEDFKIEIIDMLESGKFKNTEKITGKISFYINTGKWGNASELQEFIQSKGYFDFSSHMDGDQVRNLKFIDMCAGPEHVASTSFLDANSFKIARVAGAYWMGNEKNQQLTRIYAYAFENKDELAEYIKQREEAKKRDHRVLWKQLEYYSIEEEIGLGLPLYLPNGAKLRQLLEKYMVQEAEKAGYMYVYTPHIGKSTLFARSWHLDHYKDGMFSPVQMTNLDGEWHVDGKAEEFYLKPMNCPMHHYIYMNKPRSYRELPYRLMEFGTVYRYEDSGALSGLIRVRGFTQNDAHVYCMKSQLFDVISEALDRFIRAYDALGITGYEIRFSLPDFENNAEKYGEETEEWKESIIAMRKVLDEIGIDYYDAPDEAAFYGPKIDIQVKNVNGKEDTLSTIQVDYSIAEKFGITYKNSDGEDEVPAIIHMALMGSIDRFMGFLIEMNAGRFPFWIAPEQVRVISVSSNVESYAKEVEKAMEEIYIMKPLRFNELRHTLDISENSLAKKVRQAELSKVPLLCIVWDTDMEEKTVSLRSKKEQVTIPLSELKSYIEGL